MWAKRTAFLEDHSANDAIPSYGQRSSRRVDEAFFALWLSIPTGATVSLTIRREGLSISRSEWSAFDYAYSSYLIIISVEERLERILERDKDYINMSLFNIPHSIRPLVFQLTELHRGERGFRSLSISGSLLTNKTKSTEKWQSRGTV